MTNKVFSFIINFNVLANIESTISQKENNFLFIKGKRNFDIALDYNFQKKFKLFLISENFFLCSIQIFLILLLSKIKSYKVNFYHSSYWPLFDFLIDLLKIKSNLYNFLYHDFSGKSNHNKRVVNFFALDNLSLFKKIRFYILSKTFYKSFNFLYRKVDNLDKKDTVFIISKKKYHKEVKIFNLNYLHSLPKLTSAKKFKKILILTGKSVPGKSKITKTILNKIILICLKKNYLVYFKNHPKDKNGFSSNFKEIKEINIINNAKIIELEKDDYKFVFSFTSTALMKFGKRSVCLSKFWGSIHYKEIYNYFKINSGEPEKMFFPSNLKAISKIL